MTRPPETSRPRFRLLAAFVLCVAALLAYSNSYSVPFLFDDIAAIEGNPSIEQLSTAFSPPDGSSVTGRPLVNLSFALNYKFGGRAVSHYHEVNVALHLACALLLFGLLRRTLALVPGPSGAASAEPRATLIAFAAALLWVLHPLQTAAVTYLMQRSELLVSFCYLLTLYAFIRAVSASPAPRRWLGISLVACAAGMAAKEVMVSAPLLVLLYDRMFVAGSFRAALRRRFPYYALLASSWIVLAALVLGTENRGASAGLDAGIAWPDYALTQLHAIAHYLRLAVWPRPLVFDYGTGLVRDPLLLAVGGGVILALLVGIVLAFRRWPLAAFGGIAFVALLAPSSSVVPIATQTIAEHRVYLALAVPLAFFAVGLHRGLGRRTLFVTLPLALVLGLATRARNADFRSAYDLWHDTVAKVPGNARAHYNLGVALLAGRSGYRAADAFAAAIKLEPNHGLARLKLGGLQLAAGELEVALPNLEAAVRLLPDSPAAHFELATLFVQSGRIADAASQYAQTLQLNPKYGPAHYNLGNALAQLGRYPEALAHFEEALRLDPTDTAARRNAAQLRAYLGK